MQRRLILMRHAKSSWKSDAPNDHERPLNKRGRRDAKRVARELLARDWVPELVVSSTSERTRETWARMSRVLELEELDVAWEEALYHGDGSDLLERAASWPARVGTVLALGHNPGWEHTLSALIGEPTVMTTGNAALLHGHGESWPLALAGSWRLEVLLRPRELAR